MKSTLIALIAVMTTVSSYAGIYRLKRNTQIIRKIGNSRLQEYGYFRKNMMLDVNDNSSVTTSSGKTLYVIRKVMRPYSIENRKVQKMALALNDRERHVKFYISERDLDRSEYVRQSGSNFDNDFDSDFDNDNDFGVIIDEPSYDNGFDDDYYYQNCYVTPQRKVKRINEAQRKRGEKNAIGGLLGLALGQAIAGSGNNQNLGNFISAISGAFIVAGAIDLSQSQEVIFEPQYNCSDYYFVDEYRHVNRRNGCTTTRYYSSRPGRTVEYFETTCRDGGRYMSFERSRDIWRY